MIGFLCVYVSLYECSLMNSFFHSCRDDIQIEGGIFEDTVNNLRKIVFALFLFCFDLLTLFHRFKILFSFALLKKERLYTLLLSRCQLIRLKSIHRQLFNQNSYIILKLFN